MMHEQDKTAHSCPSRIGLHVAIGDKIQSGPFSRLTHNTLGALKGMAYELTNLGICLQSILRGAKFVPCIH